MMILGDLRPVLAAMLTLKFGVEASCAHGLMGQELKPAELSPSTSCAPGSLESQGWNL